MKIIIPRNSHGTQFLDSEGKEIKDFCATRVQVTAEVNQVAKAEIDLLFVESCSVEVQKPVYHVGKYRNVRSLILEDGSVVNLPELEAHPDDVAVEAFCAAMKRKMARSRAKGRSGWNDKAACPTEKLKAMFAEHVIKGDPVDVANIAMMLWQRVEHVS